MEKKRLWKVIGGVGKGGIIVRESREVSSPQESTRLSTGSVVSEEERAGDRLRFQLISGAGPVNGWVSIRIRDKELMAPTSTEHVADSVSIQGEVQVKPRASQAKLAAQVSQKYPNAQSGILERLPKMTDDEWAKRLDPYTFQVLRCCGTDAFGMHEYIDFFPESGYFACAGCDFPLYSCASKFRDQGWPAWDKCFFSKDWGCHVSTRDDGCIEHHCKRCTSHLGHIFVGENRTKTSQRH